MIDASWHLPNTGRIGAAEFRAEHIPGAVFFDIDTIADHDQGLPHMLPKPETLAKAMTALGLGDGMRFVVYDTPGLYAAARVWWTLRAYRVEAVRILEGGLPKWIKEGRPLERATRIPGRALHPRLADSFVASLDEVRAALRAVRPRWSTRGRPTGSGARSRSPAGFKSGHMPGSLNLPFVDIVEHGALKAADALRAAFAEQGSTSRSRSSPPAARESPPPSWRWRSRRPAARSRASTTAPGRNGAPAPTARWRPGRSEVDRGGRAGPREIQPNARTARKQKHVNGSKCG